MVVTKYNIIKYKSRYLSRENYVLRPSFVFAFHEGMSKRS